MNIANRFLYISILNICLFFLTSQAFAQNAMDKDTINIPWQNPTWISWSHPTIDYTLFREQVVELLANMEQIVSISCDSKDSDSYNVVAVFFDRSIVDGLVQPFELTTRLAYSIQLLFSDSLILFSRPIIIHSGAQARPDREGQNLSSLNNPMSVINLSEETQMKFIGYEIKWLKKVIDFELSQPNIKKNCSDIP